MAKAKDLKDPKDKRDLFIAELKNLQDHVGWKIVVKALEKNIAFTSGKLHGDLEWEKDDTLKTLQDRRNDRVKLKELPENLIKDYEGSEEFPVELDPYS